MSRIRAFQLLALVMGMSIGGCLASGLWFAIHWLGPSAVDRSAVAFERMYSAAPAITRRLLDAAGYSPADRLVCPANFDGALVFSGQVMARHPSRGYRFRPDQASLWVFLPDMPYQILVPDSEQVRSVIGEAGISVTSREQFNTWGCRGPEWNAMESYAFRVLVLGDSFTEGIFVAEDETFCARLESNLRAATGDAVLVANAGVIGYSTEQEYYTMLELAPTLRPDVVLLCFYANDVHYDHDQVLHSHRSVAGWQTAGGWLDHCAGYCKSHGIRFAVAVVPDKSQRYDRATRQLYQHRLEQVTTELGIYLIDPDERFLSRRDEMLYWKEDAHFAPAGHELFAQVLGEHLSRWRRE